MLNLLPLTYSSEELGKELTPAHFITGRRIFDKPSPTFYDLNFDLTK